MELFLSFIIGLVILVLVLNLRRRVQKLEQSLQARQPAQSSTPVGVPPPQTTAPLPTPESPAFGNLVHWLRDDWLLKLGALLLLIGFGWLARYAFLHGWIGPMGRITLGLVSGALILVLGWWRIQKFLHQGEIFLVLGSTTILLTLFAAREIYDFFTPLSALVVMFLSTAFVAFVSVRYKNRSLALASLILAGVAPLLTNSPAPDYVGLFSYLFVVILGAIWIVVLTGHRELTAAALVLIVLYSLPHLVGFLRADRELLLLFAYAFSAVFFLTNTAGLLKLKGEDIMPDLVTAAGNGLFLLAWIMAVAPAEWRSLIIAAWMVVFSVGAFLIFKATGRREPFYAYAGVGVAMLAAATSAELKGATLTIAYTIESGLIALVIYAILKDVRAAARSCALLIGPMILSIESITANTWRHSVIHEDFFVLWTLGAFLLGLGLFFLYQSKAQTENEPKEVAAALFVVGSAYAYALWWLSWHAALLNDDLAVMISLVTYTLIGLLAYFYSLVNEHKMLRIYGGTLLGLVVVRLLIVDVWQMALTGRIITFFLVGALLVSTAFVGPKIKFLQKPKIT